MPVRHGPSTHNCTRVQVPWLSMSTSMSPCTSTTFSQCTRVKVQVHKIVLKSESTSQKQPLAIFFA